MPLLEVSHIYKTYLHEPLLDDISLSLDPGEILCLLGPSGCGKTTLLRIISGLEEADGGQIVFDGKDMKGIRPHHRQFGMMFQEFALFPHKNVLENVAFGLRMQKKPEDATDRRTRETLALVGLEGMERRNVGDLSGGERQRVALARSLAPQPRLLMLDEPMGSLDRALRERLIHDLRRIIKRVGVTAIFVTHDHTEAFAVADRIVVLNRGRMEQIDTPENLYKRPTNSVVARFLGFRNLLPGVVGESGGIETNIGLFYPDTKKTIPGEKATLLIRPEAARILNDEEKAQETETLFCGSISDFSFQGSGYQLTVTAENGRILVLDLPNDIPSPRLQKSVRLALRPSAMVVVF
ncbi:MAG: ABC transporter ATP-binding protein [Proteobacteria bacterium]|nr:ABC transporter ATP-binding protein [Pseudomonadota bacterium]